jgi:hypothetical protein
MTCCLINFFFEEEHNELKTTTFDATVVFRQAQLDCSPYLLSYGGPEIEENINIISPPKCLMSHTVIDPLAKWPISHNAKKQHRTCPSHDL